MIASDADEQRKHAFYQGISGRFDSLCITEDDEHNEALRIITGIAQARGWTSGLDVGAGTGRGARFFSEHAPEIKIWSVEPQKAMLEEGVRRGIPADRAIHANGNAIPLETNSLDFATCFGILHHDREPKKIVAEMLRIARYGVFISDSNRFGQGAMATRWIKLLAYQLGLWPLLDWLKTGGKRYTYAEADGYIFSFSVYDVLTQVSCWSDRVLLIPTRKSSANSTLSPQLTASHLLLAGIRNSSNP